MARTKKPKKEPVKEEVVIIEEQPVEQIKSIFKSKTFWINFLAFIAFLVQRQYGFIIDESMQAQMLMIINIILRSVTKDKVSWKS